MARRFGGSIVDECRVTIGLISCIRVKARNVRPPASVPRHMHSASKLKSVLSVSKMHELPKRRHRAVPFDVGGPGHSNVQGRHSILQ